MSENMNIDIINNFYTTMKFRRCELPMVLSNTDYDTLTSIFKDIGKNHKINILRKLFLGISGLECNKQMAIYTIPTFEFMTLVYALQLSLDKFTIADFCSGMGLFSKLYNDYTLSKTELGFPNTNIIAYDNCNLLETNCTHKFYTMNNISFETLISQQTHFDNCICVALMPMSIDTYIKRFIDICRPACFIIVTSAKKVRIFEEIFNNYNSYYSITILNVKMISYLDYYSYDSCDINHTRTIVILPKNIASQKCNYFNTVVNPIIRDVLTFDGNIEMENNPNRIEALFNDCIITQIFPQWMMTLTIEKKTDVLNNIYQIIKDYNPEMKIKLFDFMCENIKSYDDFVKYLNWKPNLPIFCTAKKFLEYKNIYESINTENDINKFYESGIFPDWIHTVDDARNFLFLDYEYLTKDWKLNEITFRQCFH